MEGGKMAPKHRYSVVYFQSPGIIWFILNPTLIILGFILWLNPELLHSFYQHYSFGPTLHSTVLAYNKLIGFICVAIIIAHLYEAHYAYKLCKRMELSGTPKALWIMQTFVLGFPSLRMLTKYYKKGKSKQN